MGSLVTSDCRTGDKWFLCPSKSPSPHTVLNSGRLYNTDLLRVVDELIEAGCDVKHADVLCVVDELIEAGCDVTHADVLCVTDELIEAGCDVTTQMCCVL